jgi:hypothetical protein
MSMLALAWTGLHYKASGPSASEAENPPELGPDSESMIINQKKVQFQGQGGPLFTVPISHTALTARPFDNGTGMMQPGPGSGGHLGPEL